MKRLLCFLLGHRPKLEAQRLMRMSGLQVMFICPRCEKVLDVVSRPYEVDRPRLTMPLRSRHLPKMWWEP